MLFVLDRRAEVERAVKPNRVVPVEPSEYLSSRFGPGYKVLAVDDLALEAREEGLGHRVGPRRQLRRIPELNDKQSG